ncbi:MAG: hypothetical protein ACRDHU_05105 [Actinomycetota bacterium]
MLDERTADRLLARAVDPDDAPPGYAEVARLIRAAAVPPPAGELGLEAAAVVAAVALRARIGSPTPPVRDRPTVRRGFSRLKVAGLVVVGFLGTTVGLAAADALPDAAQTLISDSLARIGITVPSGDDEGSAGDERPDHDDPQTSNPGDATGVTKNTEASRSTGGGPKPAEHRRPAHDPPPAMSKPSTGGTGTADAASGGASEHGTTIADERSDGHSSAGSGNSKNGNGNGDGNGPGQGKGWNAQEIVAESTPPSNGAR